MMEVSLPYPPSVNNYWRHVGPRVLISRQGRAFRERVRSVLAMARVKPLDGSLRVVIALYPPDNRRRDVDNVMKALLDALEHGGAYHDDSQIVKLEVEKRDVAVGGKTEVKIEEIQRC